MQDIPLGLIQFLGLLASVGMGRFDLLTVVLLNAALLSSTGAVGPWCFDCKDAFHPAICQDVVQCGEHESCVTEKRLSNNGGELYSSGCKATADCNNATVAVRANPPPLCSQCCTGTLCNEGGCGAPQIRDHGRLFCLKCGFVKKARDCDQVDMCSVDEVCSMSIKEQFGFDFLELDCMAKTSCPPDTATLAADKSICCDNDLCNSNELGVDPSIYTTTPAPLPGPASASFDDPVFVYNISHQVDETMDLTCRVRGGPAPTVTWTYSNGSVTLDITTGIRRDPSGDSILSIKTPQKSDSGSYTCKAQNALGTENAVLKVSVLSPPAIKGSLNETRVVKPKTNVKLPCEADDATNVTWVIPPDVVSYSIDQNNTLTLYNVHEENEAVYTCVARNADGTREKRYTLKVNETHVPCTCPTPVPVSCPTPVPASCPPPPPTSCPPSISLIPTSSFAKSSFYTPGNTATTLGPATSKPTPPASASTPYPSGGTIQPVVPNTSNPPAISTAASQSTIYPSTQFVAPNTFTSILDHRYFVLQCPVTPGYPVTWSRRELGYDPLSPYYTWDNSQGTFSINTMGSFDPMFTGVYECTQGGTPQGQFNLYLPLTATCFDTFGSLTNTKGAVVRATCGDCAGGYLPNPPSTLTTRSLLCFSASSKGLIPVSGGTITYTIKNNGDVEILK
ncbi:hemicentin-2 [Aplysia californica]|uniref:Hemicentin-2 n=1 Tax=Aplysia californica TaxID=6500 RepID=A0ABM0JYE5_APLCA|nr:hemicentin-2 [Aplysia californica]